MNTYIVNAKDINGNTRSIMLESESRYKASVSVLNMLKEEDFDTIAYYTKII